MRPLYTEEEAKRLSNIHIFQKFDCSRRQHWDGSWFITCYENGYKKVLHV